MKKNVLIIVCLVLILLIAGCTVKDKVNIKTELLIDNMSMENIAISINYDKNESKESSTFLWLNNDIEEYDDTFLKACSSNVPVKAIEKVSKELNFRKSFLELDESLIYYSNQPKYELFLVECKDRLKWKAYFLFEDTIKEVVIEHAEKMIIEGYQVEDECVYLFSKKVYKINLNDYSTELVVDAEKIFGIDSTGGMTFIKDDIFVNAVNPIMKDNQNENIGVFYKYNIETKEVETIFEKDRINSIFPYKEGYIAKCSRIDTWEPYIKYYNNKFELIKEEPVDIDSKYGNVVFGYHEGASYLYDSKIYTLMEVESSNVAEVVVISADTLEVLYQVEISNKDEKETFITSIDFYKYDNGNLINLSKF